MPASDSPSFVINRAKTLETRSEIEHIAIEGLRQPLVSEVVVNLHFEEYRSNRETRVILDTIQNDRDSKLVLIGHTRVDHMYGEYYVFDISVPPDEYVPVTIYDGTLIYETIEKMSSDAAWLALVQTVTSRYTTNRSAG